jgi:hypothetical protein
MTDQFLPNVIVKVVWNHNVGLFGRGVCTGHKQKISGIPIVIDSTPFVADFFKRLQDVSSHQIHSLKGIRVSLDSLFSDFAMLFMNCREKYMNYRSVRFSPLTCEDMENEKKPERRLGVLLDLGVAWTVMLLRV